MKDTLLKDKFLDIIERIDEALVLDYANSSRHKLFMVRIKKRLK
jgi:hypothetical protein